MSDAKAIAAATLTLQHVLQGAVADEGATVTLTRPGGGTNGTPTPTVNVFLYQVTPNAAWRNADLPTRRPEESLLQRPQAALDLHYLLSFSGDESKLEPQRLLGRVTRALHAKPLLTRARIKAALDPLINPAASSSDLEDADLADAVELVKLTPAALTLEELSKLWSIFFQTPYLLSVAYEGTVVLIEDVEDVPEPGLPVARRNVTVVPFGRPVVESVAAATGAADPIVIATTLRVRGRGLRGEVTRIRIGGSLVEPQSVEESELLVPLVQVPVAERCAGVQGIQVVHDVLLGTPALPHRGFESNVLAFVLRPTLTSVDATGLPLLEVGIEPAVTEAQRVTLLLDARDTPSAFSIAAQAHPGTVSTVVFDLADVEPGTYLVRVRVDGAESALEVVEDEAAPQPIQFVGPEVEVP